MSIMPPTSNEYEIKGILTTGEHLYLSEKLADFHFIFKSNERPDDRVPAHKLLLAGISDVFEVMFNESWKEKNEVVIVDAKATEFKEFLQFFYLGRVKLTMDNVAKVMYLGDKYNVPECLNKCTEFLRQKLTDDNICWGYELAILYNQHDLKRFCELIIGINTKAILSSFSFLNCYQEAIGNILNIDSLNCSEVELFEACMNWVKSASGEDELTQEIVQTYLGNSFHKIRIKSITIQQFVNIVPSYGDVFSAGEYKEIIQSTTNADFDPTIFSKKLRAPFENLQLNEDDKIESNRLVAKYLSCKPYYIKNIEKTIFSVNQPVLLKSFECGKIFEYKSNEYYFMEALSTKVKIVQINESASSDEELVLYSEKACLNSTHCAIITLSMPILVKPGFMYKIQLKQTPPPNCCTAALLNPQVQIEFNTSVQFHKDHFDDEADKVAKGTIIKLDFYRI